MTQKSDSFSHFESFLSHFAADPLTVTIESLFRHFNSFRFSLQGGEKDPHPQDFSLTKKMARFTKGQVRPYYGPKTGLTTGNFVVKYISIV